MYDAVFSPLRIGNALLKNRIVRTAHGTGLRGEELIAYHEARARGGVAMSILGVAGVHQTSVTPDIPVHSDAVLPFYEQMSSRLHRHGMLVLQQLWHGGSAYPSRANVPQLAPSPVPNPMIGSVPSAMSRTQIHDMVLHFAEAAGRVQDGGLDGIEIHAAHNYLIGQFLSPALNHREDEYGGSLTNRVRFLSEILTMVRERVGAGFPLGVRIVGDELIDGGIDREESIAIARAVMDQVDFIDVSLGGYWSFHSMLAPMELPLGYELPTSEPVIRAVDVPTIVSGRIMTLDHAEQIVSSGQSDLVSMVRALIADPDLVRKSQQRREAEIRPCTSTNEGCEAGLMQGRFGCVVNPAAGRELTTPFEPAPSSVRRTVVVVGGGPAGMEAARSAALRGHRVTLLEQRRELGGQVRMAASVPERSDLAAITTWLESELVRLGVEIRRGVAVDPDLPALAEADEIILATGSRPDTSTPVALLPARAVPGSTQRNVVTSWQALGYGGPAPTPSSILVVDDTGTFEPINVALKHAARECHVTLVSRLEHPGGAIDFPAATVAPSVDLLMRRGVTLIARHTVRAIDGTQVTLTSRDGTATRHVQAEVIVLCTHARPERDLSDELQERDVPHHVIGEANGTSGVKRALREAMIIGRQI